MALPGVIILFHPFLKRKGSFPAGYLKCAYPGFDSRDPSSRTDTLLLLTLNRGNGEINIISIPRDMRVNIPGYGMDKINHAYAFGGISLTMETVENFLDINVDHYMTTDFEGFINIVDILGGIERSRKKMRYYGIDVTIDLEPGLQHLMAIKPCSMCVFAVMRKGFRAGSPSAGMFKSALAGNHYL